MFPFIFFDNLQQKPIALNPFIITFPEVASPPLSSCDHIASQLSPEPVYTFDIVDRCCLGLRSLDHDSFFTSLATTYHSPSHSFLGRGLISSSFIHSSIYSLHHLGLHLKIWLWRNTLWIRNIWKHIWSPFSQLWLPESQRKKISLVLSFWKQKFTFSFGDTPEFSI